jgi:hypothetical protein
MSTFKPRSVSDDEYKQWRRLAVRLVARNIPGWFLLILVFSIVHGTMVQFVPVTMFKNVMSIILGVLMTALGFMMARHSDDGSLPIAQRPNVLLHGWYPLCQLASVFVGLSIVVELVMSTVVILAFGGGFRSLEPPLLGTMDVDMLWISLAGSSVILGGGIAPFILQALIFFVPLVLYVAGDSRMALSLGAQAAILNYEITGRMVMTVVAVFILGLFPFMAMLIYPILVCYVYVAFRCVFMGMNENSVPEEQASLSTQPMYGS